MFDEREDDDGLPVPLALIACDHVHIDPVGLTKSLLGVFVHRQAAGFPATMPLAFYFSFTGCGPGAKVPVRLRLAAPGGRGPDLLDVSQEMECAGESDVREFMVLAAGVTFPAPGAYVLEASAGGAVLMVRALFLHPARLHAVAASAG